MVVQVIVDVKVKDVNRPFSYLVPKHLEDVVERGMRVIVPFGPRKLMGYVVGIKEDEPSSMELKEIIEVSDPIPSLTDELLDLAKQMAEDTASFYIQCIQAMLPVAIKAKYQKVLVSKTDELPEALVHYFTKKRIDYDELPKEVLSVLKKAIEEELVDLVYEVKDKAQIQYDTYMRLRDQSLASIKKSAKKQMEVIDYLKTEDRPVLKTELQDVLSVSSQTLKSLITKGIIEEEVVERYRDPYKEVELSDARHDMTLEQQNAYDRVKESLNAQKNDIYLLHGVTGSGKTEVYMNLIETVITKGKESILLVPEIALTPQIVYQFKRRFGDLVAVLHSGLSIGEKYDEWRKIRKGEVKVVVGARSAIFAPFTNLGIIIIDEEHEGTYKQDEMPKYHAVEVAKIRAKTHQAALLLGSATPSLESYARAVKGVYQLIEMNERATKMEMPSTHIIDMTLEAKKGNLSIISDALYDAITDRLLKDEQVILLLNRRGYDNFILCRGCGATVMCKNCDVSLTYHKKSGRLKCHYCGYEDRPPKACPMCGSDAISGFGYGTEKVEEELEKIFPNAGILRMDNDTTSHKGAHEAILDQFRKKEAHILLGTQMIAKGLDFEDVTLVGVLMADTSLKLPDFRASEKTYQLITQVSGRAGRHKAGSDVIIQTYNPSHYAIQTAAHNHYKAFFNQEMKLRHIGRYVPYYYLCQIIVSSEVMPEAYKQADKVAKFIKERMSEDAIILGPVVPQINRIKNRYHTQLIIKYKQEERLKSALEQVLISYNSPSVSVIIDMYPNFLV